MKHSLTLIAALLLAPLASFAAPDRPNVLVICTDQQHAGMLSCAGNRWLKTPAMDSLAKNGARFERAYCVNPVCVPSRTGMFTGYTPARLGIEVNRDKAKVRIPSDIQQQAMGSLFRNAGYETACAKNIRITGNRIEGGSTACIQAFSVSGLNISGNRLVLQSAASADAVPLSLTNIENETITGNSIP